MGLNSLTAAIGTRAVAYLRLMRMDRPIGIWLLLWPTLWAVWIASEGHPRPEVFIVFVLGTITLRAAGCVINDLADRKIDPHVRRTAERPLAIGAVGPREAVGLFVMLMLLGLALVLTMNLLTIELAVVGALLVMIYPFMKRLIAAPQVVLGIAFAWSIPMSFAAETGSVASRTLWLLWLCTIVWVIIYDTQYAMADRDDDIKLGVQSTAILFGEMDIAIIIGLELVLFVGLYLVGQSAELGWWYRLGLLAAAAFALRQLYLIQDRDAVQCLRAFLNNAWFGAAIFAGIVLDYQFRIG
jgi:4-hydroxybenzoate polyprenyltransferase